MKKVIFTAAVVLSLAACSQQSDFDVELPETASKTMSVNRSADEAILIANQVLSAGDIASRGGSYQNRATKVHAVLGDQSRSGGADTLLYAVDVENDGGFILVAAPKSVEPVIAIIENGSYMDPENMEVEAYQCVLNQITTNLQSYVDTQDDNMPRLEVELNKWDFGDTISGFHEQTPKVKVAWNQRWPENIYTPNGYAGCGPIAAAQLLSYFEQPTYITYSCKDITAKSDNINWQSLKKHVRSDTANVGNICGKCTANQEVHYILARIVREIGQRAFASYNNSSTSTYVTRIINTINELSGRTYKKTNFTFDSLMVDMEKYGGVALVSGQDPVINAGHGWLADGYHYEFNRIRKYVPNLEWKPGEDPDGDRIVEVITYKSVSELLHFNWGWGGRCNGWFNIVNLSGNYIIPSDNAESFDDNLTYRHFAPTNYSVDYFLYE